MNWKHNFELEVCYIQLFNPTPFATVITHTCTYHHSHNINHCHKLLLHFVTFSTLNTVVTVGFQPNAYIASEAFGVVAICAALTGQTQRDVPVNISTPNSTGTAEGQQV